MKESINAFGKSYKIVVDQDLARDGFSSKIAGESILVAPQDKFELNKSILHETIHLISNEYGLNWSEDQVSTVEDIIANACLD